MGILRHVPTLVFLLLILLNCCSSQRRHKIRIVDGLVNLGKTHEQRKNICEEVPARVLRQVLGPGFNDFYTSVEPPDRTAFQNNFGNGKKRTSNRTVVDRRFFVQDDFEEVLSEEPAWKVPLDQDFNYFVGPREEKSLEEIPEPSPERSKRSVPDSILDAIGGAGARHFKWHCEAPLQWVDLGQDYFPRYIMSVNCDHYSCKGSRFKCEPRSFAIKVLRRRKGICAPGFSVHKDTLQIGSDQMPKPLKELWVWELRSVSFCCVCQYK